MKKRELEKFKNLLLENISEQKKGLNATILKRCTELPEDTDEVKLEKNTSSSFWNGGISSLEMFEKYLNKLTIKDLK